MLHLNPLPIETGVGDYHVNQFRIYFRPQYSSALTTSTLANDLIKNFPKYFNTKSDHRIATVTRRIDIPYQGIPSLRFLADLKIECINVDLPDIHSDWVGCIWSDPQLGFAVQTMERLFEEEGDDKLANVLLIFLLAINAPAVGLEAILGMKNGQIARANRIIQEVIHTNRKHFLAGRRSWIIKRLTVQDLVERGSVDGKQKSTRLSTGQSHQFLVRPLYYLETAAIERYSSLAYKLAEYDPGIITNMRAAISKIWLQFLSNYLILTGYEPADPRRYDPKDDAMDSWKSFGFCRYREESFSNPSIGLSKNWVCNIVSEHPALYGKDIAELQTLTKQKYPTDNRDVSSRQSHH